MTHLKPDVAELLERLNRSGRNVLPELRHQWAGQRPPQLSDWTWADLTGNGQEELVLLWRRYQEPFEQTRILVLTPDQTGEFSLLYDHTLSTREVQYREFTLYRAVDVTGDKQLDVIFYDVGTGRTMVLMAGASLELLTVPETCTGSLGFVMVSPDGPANIVRDGCAHGDGGRSGRVHYSWDGTAFVHQESP